MRIHIRIHVERVISLVRKKYRILQSKLPLDYFIKIDKDTCIIEKIVTICSALVSISYRVKNFNLLTFFLDSLFSYFDNVQSGQIHFLSLALALGLSISYETIHMGSAHCHMQSLVHFLGLHNYNIFFPSVWFLGHFRTSVVVDCE